jgi:hypothetical protein
MMSMLFFPEKASGDMLPLEGIIFWLLWGFALGILAGLRYHESLRDKLRKTLDEIIFVLSTYGQRGKRLELSNEQTQWLWKQLTRMEKALNAGMEGPKRTGEDD